MKKLYVLIIFFSVFILKSGILFSQEPISLPADPNITVGRLTSGLTYYLATNKNKTGLIDIALVQKRDSVNSPRIKASLDSLLSCSPVFLSRKPQVFLSDNGILKNSFGYVRPQGNSIIYEFNNLEVNRGEAVLDSTLLFAFSLVEARILNDDLKLSPENQALIVVGDIDKNSLIGKMKMLSLLVPKKKALVVNVDSLPLKEKAKIIEIKKDNGLVELRIELFSPRTPVQYMSTILPIISEQMNDIFGIVLRKRLKNELLARKIPVAKIGFNYRSSEVSNEEELCEVKIVVKQEDLVPAKGVFAMVLEDLKLSGVNSDEYFNAATSKLLAMNKKINTPVLNNKSTLDRCISAFLYNSSLTNLKTKRDFIAKSDLRDSTHLALFNVFVADLLKQKEDYDGVISCEADRLNINLDDTLTFYPSTKKERIRRSRRDAASGGAEWTFANGIKVIYKKMPTQGKLYFSLVLRGGYPDASNLSMGEGSFFSDVLNSYDIAGLSSEKFKNLLLANNILLNSSVDTEDVNISGFTYSNRLELVLKSLIAITNERKVNQDSWDYYIESKRLNIISEKGSYLSRRAIIDSIMMPNNIHTLYRREGGLKRDLTSRAEAFFESKFSTINNGVLIFVGDMYEDDMKKILSLYMGDFRTRKSYFSTSLYNSEPISGWSTHTVVGESESTDITLSIPLEMSTDNYFAAELATMIVHNAVATAISEENSYVNTNFDFSVFPHDRYSVILSIKPLSNSVLSCDESNAINTSLLIRKALDNLSSSPLSPALLDIYKKQLIIKYNTKQTDPSHWLDMIRIRYSESKDLNSSYAQKINSINVERVMEIISNLNSGSKLEYITYDK